MTYLKQSLLENSYQFVLAYVKIRDVPDSDFAG